jgi:predicted MPP superfamily phosphohydrolase
MGESMTTAESVAAAPQTVPPRERSKPSGARPALPIRPLHRIWRRTIDHLDLTQVELPVRGLSESLRGLVACQISDFHVDRDEDLERLHEAVEAINAQSPDLVFLTGDYFSGPDTMHRYLGEFRDALAGLAPRSAILAVLGNHDHWSSSERIAGALKSAGVEVLINESRIVPVRSASLTVVGIDDLWSRHAEPARAFSAVAPDETTVVLAHNPDTALYARHLRPGVMLSGHTHGGVVRIPGYGSPLRSILRIGKKYYSGLNPYEDFFIYTNRGLGTFWLRIRINCRPEVSRFSLVPFAPASEPHHARAVHGHARPHPPHPHRNRPRRRIKRRHPAGKAG